MLGEDKSVYCPRSLSSNPNPGTPNLPPPIVLPLLMHSTLHTYSKTSLPVNFPYVQNHKAQIFTPNTSLKPLTLTNSARTSFSIDDSEQLNKQKQHKVQDGKQPTSLDRLPIAINNSGSVSRYIWDGYELKLVSVDGNSLALSDFCFDFQDGVWKLARICGSAVRNFFLPREFTQNYLEYVKWKLLHRVFSSALQVLATQAMFRAIGIGYSHSLPSAAALNWVLKDGLGRLCRCIYTASLASAFDTNLKRVRFSTSVLFSLSIGVELLTPMFPEYFLLLASVANVAKQISLACYLATGTAVHRSFAIADNLGEVSAKSQIQTVCFDNLGLILAAVLNILFKNNQRLLAGLPFLAYPIFSAFDLFGIYQGLKHVHLQTLTKDRLEIIINTWIQQGCVPSPAEVSKEEGVDVSWIKGRKLWSIRIGCLDPRYHIPKPSTVTLQSLSDKDFSFVCIESLDKGLTRSGQHGILLCLREGASTSDIIMGLLQACYFREALLFKWSGWENRLETCDCSNSMLMEWFELIDYSKQLARLNLNTLKEQMSALGWACKNILLSADEQVRYSFVAD